MIRELMGAMAAVFRHKWEVYDSTNQDSYTSRYYMYKNARTESEFMNEWAYGDILPEDREGYDYDRWKVRPIGKD
jgi:hypothetical protein